MMGFTIPIQSKDHLKHMLNYMKSPCQFVYKADEVVEASQKYVKNKEQLQYRHLNICRIKGVGTLLGIVMTTEEDQSTDYNLLSEDGVFGYVYNVDYPECSELGYMYFGKKDGGRIGRIG